MQPVSSASQLFFQLFILSVQAIFNLPTLEFKTDCMRFAFLLAFAFFIGSVNAQVKAIKTKLSPSIVLKISSTEGFNGGAVAWDPYFKKYYASIAGNKDFSITVFNPDGKEVQTTIANADIRGMWFNPFYEYLEANIYEYHDIISYAVDENTGEILDDIPFEELYELPVYNKNAVLALDEDNQTYIWWNADEGVVYTIDTESGEELGDLELKIPVDLSKINSTSIIYTEVEGAEYGLLNHVDKLIYLFNKETGELTATLSLPSDAPTNETFNFSFANERIWLFDVEARQWIGYEIWK